MSPNRSVASDSSRGFNAAVRWHVSDQHGTANGPNSNFKRRFFYVSAFFGGFVCGVTFLMLLLRQKCPVRGRLGKTSAMEVAVWSGARRTLDAARSRSNKTLGSSYEITHDGSVLSHNHKQANSRQEHKRQ